MVTYQVSLEVDEDSSRHLGNEDEEEAGEVLQTVNRRVSLDTQIKAKASKPTMSWFDLNIL